MGSLGEALRDPFLRDDDSLDDVDKELNESSDDERSLDSQPSTAQVFQSPIRKGHRQSSQVNRQLYTSRDADTENHIHNKIQRSSHHHGMNDSP